MTSCSNADPAQNRKPSNSSSRGFLDTKKWSGRGDSNPRPSPWQLGIRLPLNVSPHKPMKAFIPDTVSHCKPIEVGVGVHHFVHDPY